MPTDQIKDVPAGDVGNQVQQLVDSDGVTEIKCTLQTNGQWTISAVSQ
jgi:hypothetical protein